MDGGAADRARIKQGAQSVRVTLLIFQLSMGWLKPAAL